MSTKTATKGRSLKSEWRAEALRLTFFYCAATDPGTEKAWHAITGVDPDRSQLDPRNSRIEESGPWEDIWLLTQRLPARLDVLLIPIPEERLEDPSLGSRDIGLFLARRDAVLEVAGKALSNIPGAVVRVAFGAVLKTSVADRVQGYACLKRYVHSIKINDKMQDFSFQVNLPREATYGGSKKMTINRLQKWSVVKTTHMQMIAHGTGLAVSAPLVTLTEHACRLELDLSTDADRTDPLRPAEAKDLFKRLVEFGAGIAEHGDEL